MRVIRASDGAEAAVVSPPVSASELDVAVLEIAMPGWGEGVLLPAFGRVDRDHSGMLTDCAAIGFPLYQRDAVKKQRFTAELHGTIYQTDMAESGQLLMRDPRLGRGLVGCVGGRGEPPLGWPLGGGDLLRGSCPRCDRGASPE